MYKILGLNNYRPITVLPTIARVFEKLLYQQLYEFLDKQNFRKSARWVSVTSFNSTGFKSGY